MKRQQPVLVDIAKAAEVSTATVSRALNGSPLVSPEVRERVRRIAGEMNYRMHLSARNLRTQKTEIVALVNRSASRRISDPFLSEFAGEISVTLRGRGYDLLISSVDPGDGEWIDRLVHSRRVDGLILMNRTVNDPDIANLTRLGVPFVVLGPRLPGQIYHSIGQDYTLGGELAARHLLTLGHRHIAAIGAPTTQAASRMLIESFRRTLREAGVPLPPERMIETEYTLDLGSAAMLRLLALRPRVTAVFAFSDLLAIAAMGAIRDSGLSVPRDISVVGFDDVPFAAYASPPLTTVHQDIGRIGQLVAAQLLDLIEERAVDDVVLPVRLVIRGSTARPLSPDTQTRDDSVWR